MVEDVMTEEWSLLRKDHAELPGCSELLFPSNDEEIFYINSIMEEIQSSLKSEGKWAAVSYHIWGFLS